jgi:hypothetical protein
VKILENFNVVVMCACCLTVFPVQAALSMQGQISKPSSGEISSFERKLDTRVTRFDTAGRTLLGAIVDLAYEHKLPLGIEYVNRDGVTRPINLQLNDETIRGIIIAIIAQAPEYRVNFSGGVVDIYAPKARDDASNLLNKVVKSFTATNSDTTRADMDLVCALGRELVPPSACFGSYAPGQWGPLTITVSLQNSTVYEILNAIVAQNGSAVWTVTAALKDVSKTQVINLWHIYSLGDPNTKTTVLNKLAAAAE